MSRPSKRVHIHGIIFYFHGDVHLVISTWVYICTKKRNNSRCTLFSFFFCVLILPRKLSRSMGGKFMSNGSKSTSLEANFTSRNDFHGRKSCIHWSTWRLPMLVEVKASTTFPKRRLPRPRLVKTVINFHKSLLVSTSNISTSFRRLHWSDGSKCGRNVMLPWKLFYLRRKVVHFHGSVPSSTQEKKLRPWN